MGNNAEQPSDLMKPKIDFAFKEIMEDEKARIGFLSAVLHIPPEDIKEASIQNPYLRKVHEEDKLGILDVRVRLNNNAEIDIEIQLRAFLVWTDRTTFYNSKMLADQLQEGQKYEDLKKCIHIGIVDFRLFDQDEEFYSQFHIWEDTRHILYSDKLEFHVIELPKLPKELRDGDNLLLWAKFLNGEKREDFAPLLGKNLYLDSAYKRLEIISQDEVKRMAYNARQKAIMDQDQLMWEANNQGLKEGLEKGRKAGLIEGMEKGHASGLIEGMEKGIAATISTLKDVAMEKETVRNIVAKKFSLSQEAADKKMSLYW